MKTIEICFSHHCIHFRHCSSKPTARPIISPRITHTTLMELTAPCVRHVWSFVLLGVSLPLLPLTEIFSVVHALTVLHYCILLYYYVMQINVVFLIPATIYPRSLLVSLYTVSRYLSILFRSHMLKLNSLILIITTRTPVQ